MTDAIAKVQQPRNDLKKTIENTRQGIYDICRPAHSLYGLAGSDVLRTSRAGNLAYVCSAIKRC
jgi:hypothetical protein